MRTILLRTILLVILLTMMSLSCHRGEQSHSEAENNETEQKARAFLQPMLHVGDSPTNLIARFGPPVYQYETQTHELSMSFSFSTEKQTALAAGVGGFTAFFTANQLTHWDPIYESENPKFKGSSVNAVAFTAVHAVFVFNVVSQNQKSGWSYVNSPLLPNGGYINNSPDLAIYSGRYIAYDSSQNTRPTVEFLLSQEDTERLRTLTSANVGNRMALLVDAQVIFAPYVLAPITDGRVILELSEPSYSVLLKALRRAH
jgi:hypothetical protein